MRFFSNLRDRLVGGLAGFSLGGDALQSVSESLDDAILPVREDITGASTSSLSMLPELELTMEDIGWRDLSSLSSNINFSRAAIRKLVNLSRIMYLLNPLIKRAVSVQQLYVWGSGVEISAKDEVVEEVLHDFFDSPGNQSIIGDAWTHREKDLRLDGNLFFVFYKNKSTGAARVRLLPVQQIDDVVVNPEDENEPWYYLRLFTPTVSMIQPNQDLPISKQVLYPDINYNPSVKPSEVRGYPVMWDNPVIHLKSGGLTGQKFGLPELFSVLNWATAYKKMLENFATVVQAYARLAMKITGTSGKKGNAAAKSKLGTGVNSTRILDNNPPNVAGGWWTSSGSLDVNPIKTANSTTGPDEARALRSMVAAGSDTPEHFFGDSDIGNFATSTTLDRPTELKMVARQKMWASFILQVSGKLIEWSATAATGKLRDAGFRVSREIDPFTGEDSVIITPPNEGGTAVTVTFPSILQRDVVDRVRSVVQAATLNGSPAEGIIPDRKLLFKLLMEALGRADADEMSDTYYPEPVLQGFADPADRVKQDDLAAQGRADLGQAALDQAAAAKIKAKQPPAARAFPPPSGSAPAQAVSSSK
jgi:hypothetical protein